MLYPEEKIKLIESLILATSPIVEPKNTLEKIIKDADMDNLWREDFFDINDKVKKEKETIKNIKIKSPDWHHASLDMIKWHKFYTPTQIRERNDSLKKNAEKLKEKMEQK